MRMGIVALFMFAATFTPGCAVELGESDSIGASEQAQTAWTIPDGAACEADPDYDHCEECLELQARIQYWTGVALQNGCIGGGGNGSDLCNAVRTRLWSLALEQEMLGCIPS